MLSISCPAPASSASLLQPSPSQVLQRPGENMLLEKNWHMSFFLYLPFKQTFPLWSVQLLAPSSRVLFSRLSSLCSTCRDFDCLTPSAWRVSGVHHVFWLRWLIHPTSVEKLNHCKSSVKMYSTHHMTMVVFLSFFFFSHWFIWHLGFIAQHIPFRNCLQLMSRALPNTVDFKKINSLQKIEGAVKTSTWVWSCWSNKLKEQGLLSLIFLLGKDGMSRFT